MRKFKFLSVFFSVLMILSMVITAVSAETEPSEALIDTEPYSVIETDPTYPTDYTEEDTEPTEYTDYTEAPTEPTTEFVRPTEYPEDYQPSTLSNYVSPEPVYTPAEQDFNEVEWEKIELDLSNSSAGIGDFSSIKNNTSRGDSNNYTLLIVGIILIALAIAGVTFVILYNPKMLAKKAGASKRTSVSSAQSGKGAERHRGASSNARGGRSQNLEQKRRSYDDYNDGF